MKQTLLSSAVLAVLCAACFAAALLTSGPAVAQAPAAPGVQAPGGIALVDVNYIFKNHARLKAQLKELAAEGERVQKDFEEQLRRLQEEGQQLSQYKPGTPDYQRLEESLVSKKAMIQGKIALMRKEFVQKEAHLYFVAYKEISDEVAYYAQQRGLALVLNFNGDPIKEDSPDEVARAITNKTVFYAKPLDITPYVLQRFKGNAPAAGATPTVDSRNLMGPVTGPR